MTQLRKSLIGFAAALAALVATVVYISRSDGEERSTVAERSAPGPAA